MTGTDLFSQANWLSPDRVRRFAVVFAAVVMLLLAGDAWLHTRAGVTDADGIQLGRDFINYWSGAQLAAHGHAGQVYDLRGFVAFERAHTAANAALKWYSYPPVALLLSLPLALTGFVPGLILWLAAGYGLNAVLLSRSLDRRWAALTAFATPAALMNALSGQNGAFSASLFAGGILLLPRRPWLAGALLGLLCFKPHLALLVPLALTAGGQGRALGGFVLSVLALCGASALLFGLHIWTAFLDNVPINVWVLQTGTGFWPRMPTPFAAAMQLGGGLTTAYSAQALSAIGAAAIALMVWRGPAPVRVKGAVLVLATFLATPYAWDYDLVAVSFAVAWLVAEARETGFRPFEKFALALAIALPLLTMPFLALVHVQPGFL
ncbi:MAG: glycosyltransferase family 87 protein, partial [Rhizomicrobium sp.]